MFINTDFSRRVSILPEEYQWVASPQRGVERMMLDRLGGEHARATSLVRYAPDSFFPVHQHPGGEEILVLAGTFSEGGEDYPAGWYLRNPPGSCHRPSSAEGAIIFVKLWQMQPGEGRRVRIDTRDPVTWQHQQGRAICPLFSDETEQVVLKRLEPGKALFSNCVSCAELLVLNGEVEEEGQSYPQGSWMRLPAGKYPHLIAGANGATCYLKIGHFASKTGEV
jgi:anti-sigma factor ChrR (cupin superfamily)